MSTALLVVFAAGALVVGFLKLNATNQVRVQVVLQLLAAVAGLTFFIAFACLAFTILA